jgi:hypothetical protein
MLAFVSLADPGLSDTIAIIGVAASLGTELLWPWISRRYTNSAMLLQEMFDTKLYGLPWNAHLGDRIPGSVIHRLNLKYRGDEKSVRDWYVDVSGLSRPDAIMVCQRENLLWDAELRLAWAGRIATCAALWIAIGISVALVEDWSTRALFVRWFAPSAPLLLFVGMLSYGHWKVATEKSEARRDLEHLLDARTAKPLTNNQSTHLLRLARTRQDKIANLRRRAERVPRWFYMRRKQSDQAGHDMDASQIRRRLLALSSTDDA